MTEQRYDYETVGPENERQYTRKGTGLHAALALAQHWNSVAIELENRLNAAAQRDSRRDFTMAALGVVLGVIAGAVGALGLVP